MKRILNSDPSFLDVQKQKDLCQDEQFTAERLEENAKLGGAIIKNVISATILAPALQVDSVDEVHKLVRDPLLQKRQEKASEAGRLNSWSDEWSDRQFAWEQLNVCRGFGVQRVNRKIPKAYYITDADIPDGLLRDQTISQAIAAGRLFMVDLSILEGIPSSKTPFSNVC